MTTITIEKSGDAVIINADGHAEYNPGNDIVCAAISMITQTLYNALSHYEEEKQCKILAFEFKSGVAKFAFVSYNTKVTDALMTMAEIGYTSLVQSYPNNVKLIVS